MSKWLCRLLFLGVVFAVGTASPAQDKEKKSTKELERKIRININRAINIGAKLYNDGDRDGCYQVYRGALVAVSTLLDHREGLEKSINTALEKAEKLPVGDDRAFALRKVMDEIMKALTLWERLGGEVAVRLVIREFMKNAAADPKVNITRTGKYKLTDKRAALLEQRLVEFVSIATGGPLKYKGKEMKAVHNDMRITNTEFTAAMKHLRAALTKYDVSKPDKEELLQIVETTRRDIVDESLETDAS